MRTITHHVDASREADARQQRFLRLLPSIENQAGYAFRGSDGERRDELTQEVVAAAWSMYVRLCELGKAEMAYATPLAQYAIGHIRVGRRTGQPRNVFDVTSRIGQCRNGHRIRSLHGNETGRARWMELLAEDKRSRPDEIAAARLDFRAWLATLSSHRRRVAETLAAGESTGAAAGMFGLSPGRISQLRRELEATWRRFQNRPGPASVTV